MIVTLMSTAALLFHPFTICAGAVAITTAIATSAQPAVSLHAHFGTDVPFAGARKEKGKG